MGLKEHTPHGEEEKAATLESGGSASGNVGGGRSQVQTSSTRGRVQPRASTYRFHFKMTLLER